jgi:hypothetical protein
MGSPRGTLAPDYDSSSSIAGTGGMEKNRIVPSHVTVLFLDSLPLLREPSETPAAIPFRRERRSSSTAAEEIEGRSDV